MWNEPSRSDLERMPKLYETAPQRWQDKLIYEHFFIGGCDWYAAEYGPKDRLFFGFAILNDDMQNAEWGYFSLDEMRGVKVRSIEIDRDLHWQVRKASEVERIVEAHRLQGQR
jgi:hypothetical protein